MKPFERHRLPIASAFRRQQPGAPPLPSIKSNDTRANRPNPGAKKVPNRRNT